MADLRKHCWITAQDVREHLSYDPCTGELKSIKLVHGRPIGTVIRPDAKVSIKGFIMKASQAAWMHYHGEWPTHLIDHRNRNELDISIANLRYATHTQNQYNKVSPNPHGLKGVTWRNRKAKPWLAKIRVDGVRINLGSFETKEEAGRAYEEACLKYHGEFAQLGVS